VSQRIGRCQRSDRLGGSDQRAVAHGDKITVTSAGVTNGTVAVGYWYYE
jgi:hypothetical protein